MSRLAFAFALASLAACTDPDVVDPPFTPIDRPGIVQLPHGTTGSLAHVTVHTYRPEVLFSDASGAIDGKARVDGDVATADVPVDSAATVPGVIGHIFDGNGPRLLRTFDTATGLADGDDVTLGAWAQANLPMVTATLPALPEGATTVTAYWCGRSQTLDGATAVLDRTGCGDRHGALFVASNAAPVAAIRVVDLGDGALDLGARAWTPLEPATVTLAPAPSASRAWTVRSGAILDGDVIPLGDELPATSATATVPVFAGGAVIASVDDEPGEAPTLDQIAIARPDASPFTIDLAGAPFPALDARATAPRTFAIGGDVDAARDRLAITADAANATSLDTWHVQLRGRDRAFTLPSLGDVDATLSSIELTLRDASATRVWIRRQPFVVP